MTDLQNNQIKKIKKIYKNEKFLHSGLKNREK